MLTTLDEVIATRAYLARRFGWKRRLDHAGVAEALREAAALVGERPEDEPAALLLSLWRRPNDLTDGDERLPLVLVMNVARRLGYALRLDLGDEQLIALRWRMLARAPATRPSFEEVRALVAARLRPLR